MLRLRLDRGDPPVRRVLCLGAHCDDLEIGCGGTLLTLLEGAAPPAVTWVVLTSDPAREAEAVASARGLLEPAPKSQVIVESFRDGSLAHDGRAVKAVLEALKAEAPDLILTHYRGDLHQDHRFVGELTWHTFRDHLILEYEIPKYDGDLGRPNVFVPLAEDVCRRKIDWILRAFPSQAGRRWFAEDTFRALLRLRGLECNAASRHAEAFYCGKLIVA